MSFNKYAEIKGVIFDLDGTLYKKKWFMKPLMALFCIPNTFLLPAYMRIRKKYAGKNMKNGKILLSTIAKEMGNEKKNYKWLNEGYYFSFVNSLRFMKNSRPGINDMLKNLKDKSIKLAILSDYAKIEERLNTLDIDTTFFDFMISSETEGCLKPSKEPFLKIAEKFNLSPRNILVIGDRYDTDGAGAQESGMPFLKITDKKEKNGKSWDKVKEILEKLC